MRIEIDPKYDFSDVLIRPKRSTLSSRKEVALEKTYTFLHSETQWTSIPIVAANMDHTGTMEMAKALKEYKLSTALHKHYSKRELIDFFYKNPDISFWYSMGVVDRDLQKFEEVYKETDKGINFVCIDVANGYSERFVDFVKNFREQYPRITIMAGNVVTGEMTEQLILAGADVVKVGIGPGSVCTTRKVTGVGYPQLSAVIESADAAHGLGGLVCSDGGCTTPGDVAKAFGAGADFVMLGGMLAGHDECDGDIVDAHIDFKYTEHALDSMEQDFNTMVVDGNTYAFSREDRKLLKEALSYHSHPTVFNEARRKFPYLITVDGGSMKFYGMSSKPAMDKHSGGVAEYRASEGKEVQVPYKGFVENTVKEILGGVRSACTYTGSKTLKELPKRTTFVRVNQTHNKVFGE